MGALLLPSERSTRFRNPAWPGFKTANFAAFGSWPGVLPKNAESLRNSDALMRVAVPRRRGPAGLRDLFRFCRNRDLYIRRSGLSACMGQRWYHYPQCALHVLETLDGRLSKRLICRFLRSGGRSSPHDSYFLANTQNFLLAVPVANAFALWYDKFSKLEVAYFFITKDLLSIARIVASIPSRWSYSCCMSSDISSSIRISCFSQFSSV